MKKITKILTFSLVIILVGCNNSKSKDEKIPKNDYKVDEYFDYQPDNPELIKEAGYTYLEITNCLDKGSCFGITYLFNQCGKVIETLGHHMGRRHFNKYDENCRLIKSYSLDFYETHFERLPGGRIRRVTDGLPKDSSEAYIDTIYPGVQDFQQIAIDTTGSMHFPCGETFEGTHIMEFTYDSLGLKKEIHYFNELGDVVVIQSFEYH